MEFSSFSSLEHHLHKICRKGLDQDVFPGVSAAVSLGSGDKRKRVTCSLGKTRLDEQAAPIQRTAFFDLASLTKPLATTLLVLRLIEQGVLNLNDRYIDIIRHKIVVDKKNITIAHLLSHSSGLTSYKPYFELYKPYPDKENTEKIIKRILDDPLEYETGADCRYSDLGFILLGDLLEQLCCKPLDILFQEEIATPAGVKDDIFYLSLSGKINCNNTIFAAAERCRWRQRIIQKEVHDEHAFLMGGIAGHAGLFGTVDGVTGLLEHIVDIWKGRAGSGIQISQSLLQKALQTQYRDKTWCLGFDTPSTGYSSAGKYFSKKSIGHLGYAGTSFWIDPEKDCIAVLLTNRVHPNRENNKIREYRPWFHNQIMEFLL